MTPTEVLNLPMQPNDADAKTIGDYLGRMLLKVWDDGECFSGKRPFGNSGWQYDLFIPLIRAGAVEGKLDSDGYIEDVQDAAAEKLIREAITAMCRL